MKTKTQILKMSKQKLEQYKWSKYLDEKSSDCSNCFNCFNCTTCSNCFNCTNCTTCSNCFNCTDCTNCSNCHLCRNANGLNYAICNVEMSKKEYEKKMAELKAEGKT